MTFLQAFLRHLISFAPALLVLCVLASFVSTQSVLGQLDAMDAPVPMGLSMQMIFEDILGTLLPFTLVFGVGLLLGLLGAALAERFIPNPWGAIHAAAGFTAVLATLIIMEAAFGIIPIAGARSAAGMFWISTGGALAGLIYLRIARREQDTGDD